MRLSVEDENYRPLPNNVKLDGIIQHQVITADEGLGYIKKFVLGGNGTPLLMDKKLVTETLFGDVQIILGDNVR